MEPDEDFRFDDRVVLITGGGRGLGRAFAKCFAAHGGSVVINSLGSSDELHPELSAAQVTLREIEAEGGKSAIIDAPVDHAEAIVDFCHQRFGRLDVIVHSVGSLRDRSFGKMSLEDWQVVNGVHLEAAYRLIHAAWPLFKLQGYGRVLLVSSAAGLYGNFGQASYSAAKMGLLGLTRTLAIEGNPTNIHCNCVAPIAATRMNENVFDESMRQHLPAEAIAPLVAYLCHESCAENGSVFEAAGGWFGKVRIQRSVGVVLEPTGLRIGDIARHWQAIGDFTDAESPETAQESLALIMDRMS